MKKRGSLFYIIDSFIAAAIITLTLVIIIASYNTQTSPDVVYDSLENYINFLETIELRNAPGTTARAILNEGLISDPKMNIFETVAELFATGHIDNATMLVEEITNATLEIQFGLSLNITDIHGQENIYERYVDRIEKSDVFLNRRMSTNVLREGRLKVNYVSESTMSASHLTTDIWGYYECTTIRSQECLGVELVCSSAPVIRIVEALPGCIYGYWPLPTGCSVNRAICAETLQTEIYGPYEVEVTIWV